VRWCVERAGKVSDDLPFAQVHASRFIRQRAIERALKSQDPGTLLLEGSVWVARSSFGARAAILRITETQLVLIEYLAIGRARVLEIPRDSVESLERRGGNVDIAFRTPGGVKHCRVRGWSGRGPTSKPPVRLHGDELLDELQRWRARPS
jgi:hypothetical protein